MPIDVSAMRIVADTNTIISGTLWGGKPNEMLNLARSGRIVLYSSPKLLDELASVLSRPKFEARLQQYGHSAAHVVLAFSAVAAVVQPVSIPKVILADPDDDAVLACALAARAEAIVSGDRHLLALGVYEGIPIITAAELLSRVAEEEKRQ